MKLLAADTATIAATGATVSGIEALTITTGIGNDVIDTRGVTGNDVVATGEGNDTFKSNGGADSFDAGGGSADRLIIDYSDAQTAVSQSYQGNGWYELAEKAGSQSVRYVSVETYDITGGSAGDSLTGGAGSDVFVFSNPGGAGLDRITDANAADHDIIRLSGVTLGRISNGSGAGALAGEVQISASLGVTTLHIGLDGTAGADFAVQLVGTFTAASFTGAASDLML